MIWRIIYSILAVAVGVFFIVYGGYDDSPGGQLLGLLLLVFGVVRLIKRKR